MDRVEIIFADYIRLRINDHDMNTAFNLLRTIIEPLPKSDKRELVTKIRSWEQTEAQTVRKPQSHPSPLSTQVLEPLMVLVPSPEDKRAVQSNKPTAEKETKITNFPGMGTQMLNPGNLPSSMTETQQFLQLTEFPAEDQEEYFKSDSVLELNIRGTSRKFRLRPQQHEHEIFIGRRAPNSAMTPDVDLSGWNAEKMGVSQLHLSIKHNPDNNTLMVYDLSSTNGSYINGRRLIPNRGETIRHGDDLQLGHMILFIRFLHAAAQVKTSG